MNTLTLHIDDALGDALERLAQQRQQNESVVARDLLRGGLVRAALRQAQQELEPQARACGWFIEGDVLQAGS